MPAGRRREPFTVFGLNLGSGHSLRTEPSAQKTEGAGEETFLASAPAKPAPGPTITPGLLSRVPSADGTVRP
eukprot:3342008-Prymnesium_polylepis.1